jgi:hypothetical protein
MPRFSNPLNNHRESSAYVAAPDPHRRYTRAALGLPGGGTAGGAPLLACFNSGCGPRSPRTCGARSAHAGTRTAISPRLV